MQPQNYSTANMSYSSRQGKKDPKGGSEIIKAASPISKEEAITRVSTGRMTPRPKLWRPGQ